MGECKVLFGKANRGLIDKLGINTGREPCKAVDCLFTADTNVSENTLWWLETYTIPELTG